MMESNKDALADRIRSEPLFNRWANLPVSQIDEPWKAIACRTALALLFYKAATESEDVIFQSREDFDLRGISRPELAAHHPWQHQWWVGGHYRAQWYPGEQAHKVIWIAPHLKGPSDKPVLEKVYAVVQ